MDEFTAEMAVLIGVIVLLASVLMVHGGWI